MTKFIYQTTISILLITLLGSCRSWYNKSFEIEVLKPAPLNIGLYPKVSVIETQGALRSMEENFAFELIKMGRSRGYDFKSKMNNGIEINKKYGRPNIVNIDENTPENEYFCSIEIINRKDEPFIKPMKIQDKIKEKIPAVRDKNGKIIENEKFVDKVIERVVDVEYIDNEVILIMTLANKNEFIIEQKEFGSNMAWERNLAPPTRDLRYEFNYREIVKNFLRLISYKYESTLTYMDNSDENQQYIIDQVKRISPKYGIDEFNRFIAKNPQSASAYYNLAVLYDVMGDYKNALFNYDKAISLNPQENDYKTVKFQCEVRKSYKDATK